jgi:hypothetical protein
MNVYNGQNEKIGDIKELMSSEQVGDPRSPISPSDLAAPSRRLLPSPAFFRTQYCAGDTSNRNREPRRCGNFDGAIGVGTQKLHVANLDGLFVPDLANDPRHRIGMAGAVERGAWIVDVNAL